MEERIIVSKTADENMFHIHPVNFINGFYVLDENLRGFDIDKQNLIDVILKGDKYYILNEEKTSIELLEIGIINNMVLPIAERKVYKNGL